MIFGGCAGRKWLNEVFVLETGTFPHIHAYIRDALVLFFMYMCDNAWFSDWCVYIEWW